MELSQTEMKETQGKLLLVAAALGGFFGASLANTASNPRK